MGPGDGIRSQRLLDLPTTLDCAEPRPQVTHSHPLAPTRTWTPFTYILFIPGHTQKQLTHKAPLAVGIYKAVVLGSRASLDCPDLLGFIALLSYCHSLCYGGKSIYKFNTPPLIFF
jgi:hypothetical protein